MAYVTASNGDTFFLWPLPEGSARGVSPGIQFNEISNDLGNGYQAQELYGADTGLKTWQITQNTLGGTDFPLPYVTGVNGEEVSQEQALWDLYCEQKVTGKPFVFVCPRDGQQYLVKFDNPKFEYEKVFRAAQYSGQLSLSQVREDGVSVFDIDSLCINNFGEDYDETGHSAPNWIESSFNAETLNDVLGTATFDATTQNSRNIVRLAASSATRFVSGLTPVCDLFVVMKVRETTFSNSGVLIGTSTTGKIKGTSAGTKWQNPSHSGLQYWLNGTEYAVTDMQAPMNTWGIVRVRSATPLVASPNAACIGAESSSNGLKADIAEIVMFPTPLSIPLGRQLTEHLAIKWDI